LLIYFSIHDHEMTFYVVGIKLVVIIACMGSRLYGRLGVVMTFNRL
jgi:hypothetical protein